MQYWILDYFMAYLPYHRTLNRNCLQYYLIKLQDHCHFIIPYYDQIVRFLLER
jgi:hypothetical protein